jgi:hypothetical protein
MCFFYLGELVCSCCNALLLFAVDCFYFLCNFMLRLSLVQTNRLTVCILIYVSFAKIPSVRHTVNVGPQLSPRLISVWEADYTKQVNSVCSCVSRVYFELLSERGPENTFRKHLRPLKLNLRKYYLFGKPAYYFYSCNYVPYCACLRCLVNMNVDFWHCMYWIL